MVSASRVVLFDSISESATVMSLPAVTSTLPSASISLLSMLISSPAAALRFSSVEISDSLIFKSSSALKFKSPPVSTELSEILTLLFPLMSVSSSDSMLTLLNISMESDNSPLPEEVPTMMIFPEPL